MSWRGLHFKPWQILSVQISSSASSSVLKFAFDMGFCAIELMQKAAEYWLKVLEGPHHSTSSVPWSVECNTDPVHFERQFIDQFILECQFSLTGVDIFRKNWTPNWSPRWVSRALLLVVMDSRPM